MSIRSTNILVAATVLASALAGCRTERAPMAYGHANSIIVVAPDSIWAQVREPMQGTLQPRIFTVRDEKTFELTHVSPEDPNWRTLRQWRQVLVVGRPGDPWITPVIGDGAAPALPALLDGQGVWARGQEITVLLLPESGEQAAIERMLPVLHELFDGRFRRNAQERMFASGVNRSLARRLMNDAGFSLYLPEVYRWDRRDETYVFRNHQRAQAGDLVRSILVTWRPGAPRDRGEAEPLLALRDSVAREFYSPAQRAQRERVEARVLEPAEAYTGREVRGIWELAEGVWPGAGSFILRELHCPAQDRTYYVDAWLYAPGSAKYEYTIQLETILDTFRCGG
jgi:hypothetical protein